MTTDSIQGSLKAFLGRFLSNYNLADDEDFFALGLVNSLMAMQLVAFVEKEFSITVEDEDLDLDNFRTINAIAALVGRKQSAATGA